MDIVHERAAGLDISKRDAKVTSLLQIQLSFGRHASRFLLGLNARRTPV